MIMKTKLFNSLITACAAALIYSCGGSGGGFSSSSNDYLNYLPSIANNYEQQIEAKKKAIHDNTSIEDAFKLDKELDLLKEEWDAKIKESNISDPITKPLPFEALPDMPYTINQVTIDKEKVYKANITMNFDVTIKQDIKNEYGNFVKTLFVYYTAMDKSGTLIPGVVSVGMNMKPEELKAGLKCLVSAQLGPLAKLEDFAKIKIITNEEYKTLKK